MLHFADDFTFAAGFIDIIKEFDFESSDAIEDFIFSK